MLIPVSCSQQQPSLYLVQNIQGMSHPSRDKFTFFFFWGGRGYFFFFPFSFFTFLLLLPKEEHFLV